jgi:hypothetical protein
MIPKSLILMIENRLALHIEIKILRELTITEDPIDLKENRKTLHSEIKTLRK